MLHSELRVAADQQHKDNTLSHHLTLLPHLPRTQAVTGSCLSSQPLPFLCACWGMSPFRAIVSTSTDRVTCLACNQTRGRDGCGARHTHPYTYLPHVLHCRLLAWLCCCECVAIQRACSSRCVLAQTGRCSCDYLFRYLLLEFGSLAVVKMYFHNNWLALVGGRHKPVAETNKGTLSHA